MRRAPRVKPGDRITARLWNTLADVVDGPTRAPRDIESDGALPAADADEPLSDLVLVEQSRESNTVRVFNPEDSSQYVDVSRADFSYLLGTDGRRYGIDWLDG